MNPPLRKLFFALLFLTALLPSALAQNITGIWRGRFVTTDGDEYKFELQVDQTKSNRLSGVTYSYLDTRFYGKATITGSFTKGTQSALVQEIKTVELKMDGGSTACIMKCLFTYSKSGKEEFLEGTYSSAFEKTEPLKGIMRGGNCGGGKVFLRKVTTSDFYVEPFLRKPATPEPKKDTVVKKPVVVKTPGKPTTKPVTNNPVVKQPVIIPKVDTVRKYPTGPVVAEKTPVNTPPLNLPTITRSRENELAQTVTVSSEEIMVRLYDNGEIDGDTISVYLDGKLLLANKGLSTTPITFTLKMDENSPDHVLIMVAENLGRIPPNTSLMLVYDGEKRYQVGITSTEQKNAMVRFRYKKN